VGDISKRRCGICGNLGHDKRTCKWTRVSNKSSTRPFDPWLDLEFGEHEEAKQAVLDHPDGMTLEEVGKYLGVTRERVRQIEVIALRKLRTGINLESVVNIDGEDFTVIECDRCGELFPRMGRSRYCLECEEKKAAVPKKVKSRPPVKEVEKLGTDTSLERLKREAEVSIESLMIMFDIGEF